MGFNMTNQNDLTKCYNKCSAQFSGTNFKYDLQSPTGQDYYGSNINGFNRTLDAIW